jgi:formamidopyrimidine-DNA glycosylase
MYHAKLHPEQYSHTFSSAQLKQLHKSILYVCQTAVDALADSSKFPDEWLFNHRWGKGKKDAPTTLPNGEKIAFLTVGGRTSCICPSIQKKTGAVAGDVKKEAVEQDFHSENSDVKPARKAKGGEKSDQRKIASTKAGSEGGHAEEPDSKDSIVRKPTNETSPRKRKAHHLEGEKTKAGEIVPESKAKTKKRKASHQDEENASKEDSVRVPKGKTKKQKATDEIQMTSTSDAQIALGNRRRSSRVWTVKT